MTIPGSFEEIQLLINYLNKIDFTFKLNTYIEKKKILNNAKSNHIA